MAIRTYIQISVVFADAVNLPMPPTQKQAHYLNIRLLELPETNSTCWEMSVSESIMREESQWTASLSSEESQQLSALLGQIPAESMFSKSIIMDGSETEMLVIRADQTRSFRWELDLWRYGEAWASVGAVAGFIMEATEKYRSANSKHSQ